MIDKINKAFAERLNEACVDKKIPERGRAASLARMVCGNTDNPMTARNWLKGATMPRREHTATLAKKLGVRLEWLLFGSLPKRRPVLKPGAAKASANYISDVDHLSHDQAELLSAYQSATPEIQSAVRKLLDH